MRERYERFALLLLILVLEVWRPFLFLTENMGITKGEKINFNGVIFELAIFLFLCIQVDFVPRNRSGILSAWNNMLFEHATRRGTTDNDTLFAPPFPLTHLIIIFGIFMLKSVIQFYSQVWYWSLSCTRFFRVLLDKYTDCMRVNIGL